MLQKIHLENTVKVIQWRQTSF